MKLLPLLLLSALLSGCLLSTNPNYTEDSTFFDERLVGTYEKEGIWIVAPHPESPKQYRIQLRERNESIQLKGTLFRLGESTYLDIQKVKEKVSKAGDPAGPSQVQFLSELLKDEKHAVLGIQIEENGVTLFGSDIQSLRKFRNQFKPKEGRMNVFHEQLTLTTGTEESQAIISDAHKNHGLFNQPMPFVKNDKMIR